MRGWTVKLSRISLFRYRILSNARMSLSLLVDIIIKDTMYFLLQKRKKIKHFIIYLL